MNDPNAERTLRRYKGFENSVKQMLTQEYKFLGGEKIQEMFIKDLLVEFNRHLKDGWKLDDGQVVWWAVHKDEYPGRNGVLNQADVSLLMWVSAGTIGKDIREFQLEHGVILPYRGTVHDIGPTLTHKKDYHSAICSEHTNS